MTRRCWGVYSSLGGRRARNDRNDAARSTDLKLLSVLKARTPESGLGNDNRLFVFQGHGHHSNDNKTIRQLND